MTPEARTFIVKCFFGKVSSYEVAWLVNDLYDLHGRKVSAADVRKIWDEERETNTVLRLFEEKHGPRPICGYPQNDETRVAERMAAV